MKAFFGEQTVKEKYLARVREHQRLDEITKGTYFEDGKPGARKMCAVGCTIHGDNHADYETELGIPEWLAKLEDAIFEALPNERAKLWPEQFLDAIKPGANLDSVKTPFIIFILGHNLERLASFEFDADKFPKVAEVVERARLASLEMIRCHREGLDLSAAEAASMAASLAAALAASLAASQAASMAASMAASLAAALGGVVGGICEIR